MKQFCIYLNFLCINFRLPSSVAQPTNSFAAVVQWLAPPSHIKKVVGSILGLGTCCVVCILALCRCGFSSGSKTCTWGETLTCLYPAVCLYVGEEVVNCQECPPDFTLWQLQEASADPWPRAQEGAGIENDANNSMIYSGLRTSNKERSLLTRDLTADQTQDPKSESIHSDPQDGRVGVGGWHWHGSHFITWSSSWHMEISRRQHCLPGPTGYSGHLG